MAEGSRERSTKPNQGARVRKPQLKFYNPYPWMSDAEAMVHLELEKRNVPFSWRWFDGDAPNFTELLKGQYYPEFTLKEYRIVIVVQGNYFSTLPGVLDKTALAQVTLQADGWKFYVLWENDIKAGVADLIDRTIPELVHPAIQGPPRPNPYGVPNFMQTRKRLLVNRRAGHSAHGSPKGGTHSNERRLGRKSRRFGELGRRRRGLRR